MQNGEMTLRWGREFWAGLGLFWRGVALSLKHPRLFLLGLIPAFAAFLILAAVLSTVGVFLGPETAALTGFAATWAPWARTTAQVAAGAVVIGVALLLSIWVFTALALAIGDPFYQRISDTVDDEAGTPVGPASSWSADLLTGVSESARIAAFAAPVGLGLMLAGMAPLVGQTVVPVAAALFGGWVLVLELSATPFRRRGLNLARRRQVLRQRRWLVLGLGTMTFVMFLVPLGAVLFMPAAVTSATLLTQQLTDRSPESD